MKNFLFILLLVITGSVLGQTTISNPDFEDWYLFKPDYNFYAPSNWSDGSACVSFNQTETCEFYIQRINDAQSGQYALAHFTTDNGSGADYSTFSNLEGTFTPASFTGRPTSFSFYYKYSTDDNQPMTINVTLLTGTLTNPTFIGQGTFNITSSIATYTKVTQSISYYSQSAPTGIFISFDYPSTPATGFDTLKIDNITLNYPTGVISSQSQEVTVFVNDKELTSSVPLDNTVIYDINGSSVILANKPTKEIDLSFLKDGVYILKAEINGMPVIKKVFVQ